MSIRHLTTVPVCDDRRPGEPRKCGQQLEATGDTATAMRRAARREGWSRFQMASRAGKFIWGDACASCTARRAAA